MAINTFFCPTLSFAWIDRLNTQGIARQKVTSAKEVHLSLTERVSSFVKGVFLLLIFLTDNGRKACFEAFKQAFKGSRFTCDTDSILLSTYDTTESLKGGDSSAEFRNIAKSQLGLNSVSQTDDVIIPGSRADKERVCREFYAHYGADEVKSESPTRVKFNSRVDVRHCTKLHYSEKPTRVNAWFLSM